MQIEWRLSIYPDTQPNRNAFSLYVGPKLYAELYNQYYGGCSPNPRRLQTYPPGEPHSRIDICEPEDSTLLADIMAQLSERGYKWHFWSIVPRPASTGDFSIRRFRIFDTKDRAKAEYLSVFRWSDLTHPFELHQDETGRYGLAKVTPVSWKTRYGFIYSNRTEANVVNGELKRALEAENLAGLTFEPVVFDRPEKARGEFWWVGSSVILPPCQTPVVEVPDATPPPFQVFDDGGYFPHQLTYRTSDLASAERFDVALTREVTGKGRTFWRTLIVSQRARKAFGELKMGTVELVPVVLI